jgi:hypothetical protein
MENAMKATKFSIGVAAEARELRTLRLKTRSCADLPAAQRKILRTCWCANPYPAVP